MNRATAILDEDGQRYETVVQILPAEPASDAAIHARLKLELAKLVAAHPSAVDHSVGVKVDTWSFGGNLRWAHYIGQAALGVASLPAATCDQSLADIAERIRGRK